LVPQNQPCERDRERPITEDTATTPISKPTS